MPLKDGQDSIVVLPFRWKTVDAYYYMETFAKLRTIKGSPEELQTPQTLTERMIAEVDEAIVRGGYLSILFHPFLNDDAERLKAFEHVVSYLASKREEGIIWLTRCNDVQKWLRENPDKTGSDPVWDETVWR